MTVLFEQLVETMKESPLISGMSMDEQEKIRKRYINSSDIEIEKAIKKIKESDDLFKDNEAVLQKKADEYFNQLEMSVLEGDKKIRAIKVKAEQSSDAEDMMRLREIENKLNRI